MVKKKERIFFYLLALTTFFLLLEISFFIQANKAYLADFTLVSDSLHIPPAILPGLLFFIGAQLLVHFSYLIVIYLVTIIIAFAFNIQQRFNLGLGMWFLGLVTILVANQYYFPNSKFAELTQLVLFTPLLTKIVFYFLLGCSLTTLILALLGGLFCFARQLMSYFFFVLGFISLTSVGFYFHHLTPVSLKLTTFKQPNIIIIGVDALRPDFLSFFGHSTPTPFFDALLSKASVFSDALTPLARTFPSWNSILTGEYPRNLGVRFNLAAQTHLNLTQSLPAILQKQGYETIYATDETRFSNIDKNYGFDRVITPPMGLNDFLIGTFNDFPLSNLLVNTFIGKWLFPYSYANRPVYFTYDPNSFLELLKSTLDYPPKKPLFMTVHFCLTHYPYLWASQAGDTPNIVERYERSIVRADRQVGDFIALLHERHLLDHAILVFLSDHGEALEMQGDRITEKELFVSVPQLKQKAIPHFYPASLDQEEVNQSLGHGTDVLGVSQYHTLLAFQLHGMGNWQPGIISGLVSLLDIKPTLLQLLQIDSASANGQSLAPVIKGEQKALSSHTLFLESDFTPAAIRTVYPDTSKVMMEGIDFFEVNPKTTRLTVKKKMGAMIINSKQYAILDGEWMLALYPYNNQTQIPILINLVTGAWTNDLQSAFARHSTAKKLLSQLKLFYGREIRFEH